ncbi:MAG: hypothetical protein AB1467_06750 [Candidatus Diapherotrites archaeon]
MVEYIYPILDANWDIHWLRPRIYYECGFFPDWITLAYPNTAIGFNSALTANQKLSLDNAMKKTDIGLEPINIKHKLSATINPEKLTQLIQTIIGKKILYHCIDGKVDLIFLENVTAKNLSDIEIALGKIWK